MRCFSTRSPRRPGRRRFVLLHRIKVFTSLAPVWTKLGVFGKDAGSESPTLVHGFLDRDTPGIEIPENWNTLGMRATQSNTTILTAARVPAEQIHRCCRWDRSRTPWCSASSRHFCH